MKPVVSSGPADGTTTLMASCAAARAAYRVLAVDHLSGDDQARVTCAWWRRRPQSATAWSGRKILGDLVDRARLADEQVLITRYNKPAAVIVGADWYARMTGEPVRPEGGAS